MHDSTTGDLLRKVLRSNESIKHEVSIAAAPGSSAKAEVRLCLTDRRTIFIQTHPIGSPTVIDLNVRDLDEVSGGLTFDAEVRISLLSRSAGDVFLRFELANPADIDQVQQWLGAVSAAIAKSQDSRPDRQPQKRPGQRRNVSTPPPSKHDQRIARIHAATAAVEGAAPQRESSGAEMAFGLLIMAGILAGIVWFIHHLFGSWWAELVLPATVIAIGLFIAFLPKGKRLVPVLVLTVAAAWLMYAIFPKYRDKANQGTHGGTSQQQANDGARATFLLTVREIARNLPSLSDQALVNVGHAACTDLQDGDSFDQALADAATAGFSAYDGGVLIGAAVDNFCPAFKYAMPGR